AGGFTLREAIARAREESPARRAAMARVEAADLSRGLAGRYPNPLAEIRVENWAPGLHDRLPYDTFATVTQTVELGGKRAARQGVAAAGAQGARAALWSAERELEAEVARRYLTVLRDRERERTLADHAAGLVELVRILERRVAEGVAAEADLEKLRTERVRVDTDAVLARIQGTRELAVLAALVGWSPAPPLDALEAPVLALPAGATAADAGALAALVNAGLDRRADVRGAVSRLESSQQTLRFERSRRVPDLLVVGGLKRTSGYDTAVASVLMPVPLFDRNQPALALARGGVAAAELELAQTRRLAEGQIRAALQTAGELDRRSRDAADQLIAPAAIVRSAARAAFQSGAGDLLRLVDAERVYADARMAVTTLQIDALQAALDARLALAEDLVP
ncbi:MAG: TolC family protein, partial [Vicinamibacterales bacterium]